MRRDQLEHAIRAACAILGADDVIVVGSQSILGTWDEDELPERATRSNEADILPIASDQGSVTELADRLEGAAGELSQFHRTHGFYLDGADLTTSVLPSHWRSRLVAVRNASTNGHTGWCLEPHDLGIAKLIAHREKDTAFVAALIEHRLLDPKLLRRRIETIPEGHAAQAVRAISWLSRF
ncbi:DUF6036 family nucleotidyltransferase [Gordonia sihwensis]|uniref:DUF6036 family nucleotidyltransferase n=1 Tax=Gordonia sihwensis TaxID=173559 RepID=UPI003D972FAA